MTTTARPDVAIPTSEATPAHAAASARRSWPIEVRWLLTGLAFPPAGLLAFAITPVDGVGAALVAGAVAGAGIGAGQWLALRAAAVRPGLASRWIGATAIAMAIGLAIGSAAVGYRTGTADLVLMGILTGAVLGPVQAVVLRQADLTSVVGAVVWAAAVPALWAAGWFVTASAGIDVERQFSNFGLYGSMTCAALGAVVMGRIVRRGRR
jgi:hypothetical protein